MKSIKFLVIALVAAIALIGAGVAMAGVVGTKHDMTQIPGQVGAAAGSEVCVYCHTPHGASANYTAPLWNKADITTTGYQPYASPTLDGAIDTSIGGVTKACLSCHDGSLAVFSMLNPPNNGGDVTSLTAATGNLTAGGLMTGNPQLTVDFTNDHPVGVVYDSALDTGLVAVAPTSTPLIGGKVECASCHDPHNTKGGDAMLVMANRRSALCLACHVK